MEKESITSKIIIIFICCAGFKLFLSCTSDPIEINYNNINLAGIDNSNRYLNFNSITDTMYADATAMKLSLSDTTMYYAASFSPNLIKEASLFQTVYITSISESFIPINKVVDIKVKTLLDINESIKTGDDISKYVLCSSRNDFSLYRNLSQGISWLNEVHYSPKQSIVLVLKKSIKNSNAQFEVKVTLDNGKELSGKTEIYSIIEF